MFRRLCLSAVFVVCCFIGSAAHAFDDVWVLGPTDNDFNCQVLITYSATNTGGNWTFFWTASVYGGVGSSDIWSQSVLVKADADTFQVKYQYEDADKPFSGVIEHSTPLVDIAAKVRAKYGIANNTPITFTGSDVEVSVGTNAEPVLVMYDSLGETNASKHPSFGVNIGTSGAIGVQTGNNSDVVRINNYHAEGVVISTNGGDDIVDTTGVGFDGDCYIWPGTYSSGDGVYGSSIGNETIYHPLCPDWVDSINSGYNIDGEIYLSDANYWLTWPTPDTVQ